MHDDVLRTAGPRRARIAASATVLVVAVAAVTGLVALGTWQLQRRAWKLDLIARVEERLHAPAVAPPGPGRWSRVDAASDEYRRVRMTGRFLAGRSTAVQAVTELGAGFWVLTPLRTAEGPLVIVNRGFVPLDARQAALQGACQPAGETSVTGLLRISEPGGAFLRRNLPAEERWYSRDIAAIAAASGLRDTAPYFVDQESSPSATPPAASAAGFACPVPGLTVVEFRNNHLVYALTWYALALMTAAAAWQALRLIRQPAEPRETLSG